MKNSIKDNTTQWPHELLEKMAGSLLFKLIPIAVIMTIASIVTQIVYNEHVANLIPSVTSLIIFTCIAVLSKRGHNLIAMRIITGLFFASLVFMLTNDRSFSSYSVLLIASILICWFAWFSSRIVTVVYFTLLLFSFFIISMLNFNGLLSPQLNIAPYTTLIAVPVTLIILYISIVSPLNLLKKFVHKSRQNEIIANRTLKELKQVRSFTIQAVNNSTQLFGWLTPDGILQYSNNTSLNIIGITSEEVVGKPFWETPWFSHDPDMSLLLRDAIEKAGRGESVSYDTSLPTEKYGKRLIVISLHPIFNSDSTVSMIVVEGRDVTDEREAIEQKEQMAEQLHQVEKMNAIGQLAGGIAHDINNLLAGIIGGVEFLQEDDLSSESRKMFSNLALTAAERAGELTKKLLMFSRKAPKSIKTTNMLKVVEDTITILNRTINKNITISITDNSRNNFVLGDEMLLQNVLLNLGINAGHAMSNGGTLTFKVANTVLDSDYCTYSPFSITEGEYLQISVRDTGEGMSPEVQSHIFEPFFTTKEPGKGTGLGLAAVYGTILDHHGALTVYSEPGKGSVFHIYLPVTASETSQHQEEVLLSGSGTILLIDDEEMVRITTSTLLTKLGYEVLLAENGEVGLEMYRTHRDKIKLIILDMIMPVMSGKDVFTKIHKDNPSLPVIIASGYAKEDDEASLRKLGVSAFLLKPFTRVELAGIVSQLTQQHNTVNT